MHLWISVDACIEIKQNYNTILLKDIVTRKKILDSAMLQSVVEYMFDNIGNMCSTTPEVIKDHNPQYLLIMDWTIRQ